MKQPPELMVLLSQDPDAACPQIHTAVAALRRRLIDDVERMCSSVIRKSDWYHWRTCRKDRDCESLRQSLTREFEALIALPDKIKGA